MDLRSILGNTIDVAATAGNYITGGRIPNIGLSEVVAGGDTAFTDNPYGASEPTSSPTQVQNVDHNWSSRASTPTSTNNDGLGYYTGGSGAVAPAYSSADLAYLQDQQARLERQRQSAGTTLKNGLTQLGDSYNREVTGANSERSRALRNYGLQREDTERGKDRAINRVDTNARTLADSLRRRIGMASGSNSSAYQITAPSAVARNASIDRTGVVEDYGQNFRNLGIAEEDAKSQYQQMLEDLEAQRKQRESDFRAGVLDQYNQIDNNLAEVARQRALLQGGGYDQVRQAMQPYSSAIDSRQSQLDGLFDRFRTPFERKPVNVQTPSLRDYTVDRATIGGGSQGQGGLDQYAPYRRPFAQDDDEQLY